MKHVAVNTRENKTYNICTPRHPVNLTRNFNAEVWKMIFLLPSGKRLHNYGKIHHFQRLNPLFLWAIFNSKLQQITRGYIHQYPSIIPSLSHYHPYKTILNHSKPMKSDHFLWKTSGKNPSENRVSHSVFSIITAAETSP